MVETFKVNHEDLREAINCQILLNIDLALAAGALEAGAHHALRLDELIETLCEFDASEEADGLPRNLHRQIHEVVEGAVLKAARQALRSVYQLSLKKIGHDGVVACLVVTCPLLTLLIDGQVGAVELLVWRLCRHSVQLVMHPIDEKAQKFLRVLLAVA